MSDNDAARRAWDANAEFWDTRMGDGNDFFEVLVWPPVLRLVDIQPGERVLDVACGNGLTTRRLNNAGAQVTGIDFSEKMIARARARSPHLDYRVVDCTDEQAMAGVGEHDVALCNMALMDIGRSRCRDASCIAQPAPWRPLRILAPTPRIPGTQRGAAIIGQPEPHPYFHLPLGALLAPAFAAGLVLDGLEETAFPPSKKSGSLPLSWSGAFSELPAVLTARLRRIISAAKQSSMLP